MIKCEACRAFDPFIATIASLIKLNNKSTNVRFYFISYFEILFLA